MDPTILNQCALRMKELQTAGLSERRRQAEENKLILQIYAAMRKTVCLMVNRKGMSAFLEDAEQQAQIAIYRACQTFDPAMASFNTYAHWQIRAELKALELTMLPERRKIKLKHPFGIFSLNMPVRGDIDENGEIGDFLLVDEQAEDDVEHRAMVHIALSAMDRLFSQYIGRKYRSFCNTDPAVDAREREVVKLMRNRDIFYRNRILRQKYNDIAEIYGVSRERIRQIIQAIDTDLDGYFPVLDKQENIIPATKTAPMTMDERWGEITEIYGFYTNEEICFVKRYHSAMAGPVEKPERLDIKRREPRIMVEETKSVESPPAATNVESIDFDQVARELQAISPISRQSAEARNYLFDETDIPELSAAPARTARKGMRAAVGGAVMMGAMALATPAAAQQSRAIPPSDTIILTADEMPEVAKRPEVVVARKSVSAPRVEKKNVTAAKDGGRVWVAKIAEYDSVEEVSQHKNEVRSAHSELASLKAAVIPARNGKKPGLGFGPLDRKTADRLCQSLKNKSVSCILVRLRS